MIKSQRLGWLLLLLGITHFFVLRNAHALPLEPSKMASELKLTPHIVRVRLSDLGNVLSIKGTDLAMSLAKKPELGNVRADEWVVDCKRSRIIQPSTGRARSLPRSGVLIESISGVLSVNERRFREQLVIYPSELLSPYDDSVRTNKQCLVVNHLDVEKYLESVVNAEFNSKWAEGAVEAQVIAARTYALFQMKEMRKDAGKVFDVESTQKDQVYMGLDNADSKGSLMVARTKGMILANPSSRDLEPIKAFYHSTCGGNTVLPQEVWGSRFAGFSKHVRCPYCAQSPAYHWDYQLSFYDIRKKILKGMRADPNGSKFVPKAFSAHPEEWILMGAKTEAASGDDPRVNDLVFEFAHRDSLAKKISVRLNSYHVRNWFDPAKLKSTLFSMVQVGRSLVFKGKGSGHGVGLCQWGAKKMGEKGFTREKILSFYYPGVKISRIW